MRHRTFVLSTICYLTGCASTSPVAAVRESSKLVESRSGHIIRWFGETGNEAVRNEVRALLASDLTAINAVRVSLLANKELQASYEELGIAQADLVQAGLLKNPSVGATVGFPLDPGYQTGLDLSLATDVIQLITLSARKNIAKLGVEGTTYRVASEVLHHIYEVRASYFAFVAAQQAYAMRELVFKAAEAAVEVARRQNETGTTSDLDLANEEALFAQVSMDLVRSRAERVVAREVLNERMGVWGTDAHWTVSSKLPELPDKEPSMEHAESKAISLRLDLAAAHKDVEVISYALALAKNTRWTGSVDAGVSYEKKPEGFRILGPTVSVELPLFDQRQATIARIEAQLRQAKRREEALAVRIRAEVRAVVGKLAAARAIVENYKRTLVPMRERIVALSQQQYNAMLLGVFQLLIAKQNEIMTYRDFIESLRDYWTLRAELEWKVGSR